MYRYEWILKIHSTAASYTCSCTICHGYLQHKSPSFNLLRFTILANFHLLNNGISTSHLIYPSMNFINIVRVTTKMSTRQWSYPKRIVCLHGKGNMNGWTFPYCRFHKYPPLSAVILTTCVHKNGNRHWIPTDMRLEKKTLLYIIKSYYPSHTGKHDRPLLVVRSALLFTFSTSVFIIYLASSMCSMNHCW